MGIFDRFRKNKQDVLPEEVEQYYKSQRRAKIGTAWLLGFVTLVITLVVALGLFYGVRYVYRQINDSDDTTEVAPVEVEQGEPESSGDSGDTNRDDQQSGSNEQQESSGNNNRQNQNSNRTRQTAPRTGDSLPSNGDTPLPHTGDPGL